MTKIKILTGKALQTKISQIVKEEVQLMVEAENAQFDKLGSRRKDFAKWVIRQYFSAKSQNEKWYDSSVDEKNVFEYISNPGNYFPQSPAQIVNFFRSMKSLQSSMSSKDVEDSLSDVKLDDEEDAEETTTKTKYQTGDVSLKDIGQELGGITPTMINKIGASAGEKMRKLTGGKHPDELTPEEEFEMNKKLFAFMDIAAKRFASVLKASNGNVGKFLAALQKAHILTPNEARSITDEEIEALINLSSLEEDNIAQVVKRDLDRKDGNNLIKTFQSLYSKTVFPPKKRGRPRKTP